MNIRHTQLATIVFAGVLSVAGSAPAQPVGTGPVGAGPVGPVSPGLTVTSPLLPGTGRHFTTRFEPLPPNVMFAFGSTVSLYDAAVSTRSSGRDSRSVITMGTSVSE